MKVLIAGATGLVGSELLKLLEQEARVSEVHVLSRRRIEPIAAKTKTHITQLGPRYLDAVQGMAFDAVICCLGSTIRAAGSQAAFRKVDLEAVLDLAHFAEGSKSRSFLVISSLGASLHSLSFYSRVKGQMESGVSGLMIPSVSILRPSLLIGHRAETRFGEKVGEGILRLTQGLLRGSFKKYRAIEARRVARALLRLALHPDPGVKVYESDEIEAMAGID
jgi:nucleoside-diphosphate-sugar epimerase